MDRAVGESRFRLQRMPYVIDVSVLDQETEFVTDHCPAPGSRPSPCSLLIVLPVA